MRLRYTIFFFFVFCQCLLAQEMRSDSLQNNNSALDDSTANNELDPDYLVANADQDSIQKIHFRAAFDGMASTGNIERVLLQFGTNFDWKPSKFLKISSSPSYIYGQQAGVLYEREMMGDLRLTFGYNKPLHGLAFGSWERSNLRQINNRWIQAVGFGYRLIRRQRSYVAISNVIIHENTDFLERTDLDLFRNSTRIIGEFAPTNQMRILTVLLYQPSISQKDNLRWSGSLTVEYKLRKGLNIRTKYDQIYESYVIVGRKNTDSRWTMGLVFEH